MLNSRVIPFDFVGPDGIDRCAPAIRAYYTSGLGDIETMKKWLRRNTSTLAHERKRKEEKSESAVYGRWNNSSMSETPKDLVNFLENAIRSKFYFPDTVLKEENYRKGNRISRGFLNGTSYKPLVGKTRIAHKKKKLMVVIDGSGSMGCH